MGGPLTELIEFPDNRLAAELFGECGAHLKPIEAGLGIGCYSRGGGVILEGGDRVVLDGARRLLVGLYDALRRGQGVDLARVEAGVRALADGEALEPLLAEEAVFRTPRRVIFPRNGRQARLMAALRRSELTLAIGPAGTGKTYLAVAAAVAAFLEGRVARIILTRPAVEAGERLGFLPGDLQAKVDPYLRPLYDALYDMLGPEKVERLLSRNLLEVAPLAYMRGRTLDEAYIILDEAQNTTTRQMRMFLTRLGPGSQAAVSGDVTQVDLPPGQESGLKEAAEILHKVEGVHFVHFTRRDVVRHPLVGRIVRAYEESARMRGD
ncbi:MAG: PhoH family protein [Magnetococcales bacterium]|nr:PhoH family protein [Magnetococcales bacterium]